MRGAVNKSIAIIGEGEIEWFYFDSLRIAQKVMGSATISKRIVADPIKCPELR
jgi:ubiquinone biosynthesis protein Coq4